MDPTIILKLSYVAYSVLNKRPLNLVLIKKNQQLHSRPQYWNDNEAAPANGGFVNKANTNLLFSSLLFLGIFSSSGVAKYTYTFLHFFLSSISSSEDTTLSISLLHEPFRSVFSLPGTTKLTLIVTYACLD